MRYYANPAGQAARDAMRTSNGLLGFIDTPAQGNRLEPGVPWCADNGVFGGKYPGDDAYLAWLDRRIQHAGRCDFAVAPDVVGDAQATLTRSAPMLPRIRQLGYPVALAAQNGLAAHDIPWDQFDVLFIGGDDTFKLGAEARRLVTAAHTHGKPVHMGRVNSERRLRYAHHIGCDSADGTYLVFGPQINLPKLLAWLRRIDNQYPLWEAAS